MKKFLLSIFAVMLAVFSVQAQVWTMVTNASDLKVGDKIVIVAKGYNYAISTEQKSNNRGASIVTKNADGTLTLGSTTQEITLEAGKVSGTFAFSTGAAGYLYAASSGSNHLKTKTTLDNNGSWAITIASTGVATIKAQGTNSRNWLRYNNSSTLFSCYSSGQADVVIYKYTEGGGTVAGKAELPNVSVANNSAIEVGTQITITPAADNTVHYTINGGNRVVIRDGKPVTITAEQIGTMTLAITTVCNSNDQTLNTTYTYTVKPVKPSIVAESTSFEDELEVEISADGDIYYTLDGTEPTTGSTVYDAPFTITETTTVKAIAVSNGVASDVAEATFTWIDPNVTTATLSFASTAQRTSYSTSQQVWEHAGVKFTNYKTANSSDVADYAPVRLYKNSTIKIETARPISKIEFDCVSGYVISISGATTSGTIVTVNVNPASTVYELTLSAQARLNSLTVTYASGDSPEPAVTAAPALPASANFENEFEVAITAEDGAAIYYTTDGTEPTTGSTAYSAPFTISETTTVKAIAVKDDVVSTVAEATYTKVKVIDLSNCTVAEAIEAYKNGQTGTATITAYIVGAANGGLSKAEFTSETGVLTNILIADNADETNVDNCMPIKMASGTAVRNALNLGENKYVYKKKVVIVGELEAYFGVAGMQDVEKAGLYWTVSNAGYATLYLGYKAEIPSTVNAYIVESTNSTHAIMTKVEGVVAANTGLILEGEGEHLFNITSAAATADVKGNLLKGTVVDENITEDAYVLSDGANGIGLYGAIMNLADGTAWLNNANKAYLPMNAVANKSAEFFGFDWDGTTAIENVEVENASNVIYDLTGRRVEEITAPGIYIVNGVKRVVR